MPDDPTTRLMVETIEQGLSRLRGRPVRVRAIHREASRRSTFPTGRLRVRLEGERSPLRIFFKDLHPGRFTGRAALLREYNLTPGLQELQMYQSVLSPERFGTLRLYAGRWDPEQGRCWLFLEDGGETALGSQKGFRYWTAAARWAARFHAGARELPEAQTRFLPRWDAAHYRSCVERVSAILPTVSGEERTLLIRGRDCLADQIDWLAARPCTVIHGQFFGTNVLLRRRGRATAVVPIDWETAALGLGVLDLVSLSSGRWTPEQRVAMWTAYLEAYEGATREPVDGESFHRERTALSVYHALYWLAWWAAHRQLSGKFAKFMDELRHVLQGATS